MPGAQACVIVFSTTDRESFDSINKWKKKVEYECGIIPMVLVQNKIDLIPRSVVTSDEVENLAKSIGLKLFRSSVKENLNIEPGKEEYTFNSIHLSTHRENSHLL